MIVRATRILPLACLVFAGCVRVPARFCLTPPYDAPAGFSETYHAALARQEPILQPGDGPIQPDPAGGFVIGPAWTSQGSIPAPADPPIDW